MTTRDTRAARPGDPAGHAGGDTLYQLVAVCLGSIFGVAVIALLIWLALGGRF